MSKIGVSGTVYLPQSYWDQFKTATPSQIRQQRQDVSSFPKTGIKQPRFDTFQQKVAQAGNVAPLVYDGPPAKPVVVDPNIIDNSDTYFDPVSEDLPEGVRQVRVHTVYVGSKLKVDENGKLTHDWDTMQYHGDKDNADRYFFHASTKFLVDAAKEYAKIEEHQEYKYRPTEDRNFVDSTLDFFYGSERTVEQYQQLSKEIDGAVRELARQIKNGETPDVNRLTSTITIADKKLTFKDIKELQADSAKFSAEIVSVAAGSDDFGRMAKRGLVKGLAAEYGKSLGGEFGELYAKSFAAGVDRTQSSSMKLSRELAAKGELRLTDSIFGQRAYDLFSNVHDRSGFNSAMEQFESIINQYSRTPGASDCGVLIQQTREELNELFDKLR